MPVDHLYISLEKTSVRSFAYFFNQVAFFVVLSCMSRLYILDINPLYHFQVFSPIQ